MMSNGRYPRLRGGLASFLAVVLIQLGMPGPTVAKSYTKYTRPPGYGELFKRPPLSPGQMVVLGAVVVGGVAALVYSISKKKPGPARARVTATNLNFGDVPIGDSGKDVLELSNDGAAPFQVVNVRISSEAFSLAQPLDLPYLIQAAGRGRIGINFTPGRPGAFAGTLEMVVVQAGKRNTKTLKVALRGKGLARVGAWAGESTAVCRAAPVKQFETPGMGIC